MKDDIQLKQKVTSLDTDALVRMVTADRSDYRDDAIAYAAEELQARKIPLERIQSRGREHSNRRMEQEFDKKFLTKAEYYFKYQDPARHKLEALAEESARHPAQPHSYDSDVHPLTPLAPEPFFTADADKNLTTRSCVLCGRNKASNDRFCLVGRHLKSTHEKNRFSYIETTTQHHFQAAYVPICQSCYRRFGIREAVTAWSAVVGIVGFILMPVSLVFPESVTHVVIMIGFYMFAGLPLAFLAMLFSGSRRYSRAVVQTNDMLPKLGVPDTKKKSWLTLATKTELAQAEGKTEQKAGG